MAPITRQIPLRTAHGTDSLERPIDGTQNQIIVVVDLHPLFYPGDQKQQQQNRTRARVSSVPPAGRWRRGGRMKPRNERRYHFNEKRRNVTDKPITLSDRQLEVLALVAQGASDNEIAIQLCLSAKTVSFYVEEIRDRLNAHSRAHAVALALQAGLLPSRAPPGQHS
jgi:DNA-binding CsgD family transcriptional regulator